MDIPLVDDFALGLELELELLAVFLDHLRTLLLEELAEALLLAVEFVLRLHLELHQRLHGLACLLVEGCLELLRLCHLDILNASGELRQVDLGRVEDVACLLSGSRVRVQV